MKTRHSQQFPYELIHYESLRVLGETALMSPYSDPSPQWVRELDGGARTASSIFASRFEKLIAHEPPGAATTAAPVLDSFNHLRAASAEAMLHVRGLDNGHKKFGRRLTCGPERHRLEEPGFGIFWKHELLRGEVPVRARFQWDSSLGPPSEVTRKTN